MNIESLEARAMLSGSPTSFVVAGDIQFRDDSEDFVYSSETLNPQLVDQFMQATEQWQEDYYQTYEFQLDETDIWYKAINHNPIRVQPGCVKENERDLIGKTG